MQVGLRYEILSFLGTGSFSTVCLALDKKLDEKVSCPPVPHVVQACCHEPNPKFIIQVQTLNQHGHPCTAGARLHASAKWSKEGPPKPCIPSACLSGHAAACDRGQYQKLAACVECRAQAHMHVQLPHMRLSCENPCPSSLWHLQLAGFNTIGPHAAQERCCLYILSSASWHAIIDCLTLILSFLSSSLETFFEKDFPKAGPSWHALAGCP